MAEVALGFGVDFGTTNSVVAQADPRTGRVRALTDAEGRPHPSVVWFRADGTTIVGREAKRNIHSYSDEVGNVFIPSIKRQLGQDRVFRVFGQPRTAIDVAAEVFKFLRGRAKIESNLEIREAVVAVPVYFDGRARRELRRAADSGGLYIKTFIHEPFAAVVGYCCGQPEGERLQQLDGRNILVFDWGGGTLDITVAAIKAGRMLELATAGLVDRAGDHFDDSLRRFTTSHFLDKNRLAPMDLAPTQSTKDRFLDECERVKISLSGRDEDLVQVAQAVRVGERVYDVDERVTRSEFEDLILADIKDAMHQVDKALETARLTTREVDLVLLIGGSSRIPLVQRDMQERFGARLVEVPNADTIIAEGAAIVEARGMFPVLARSIGVRLSDGNIYEILQAGTIAKRDLCRKSVNFFCTDNRDGQARLVVTEEIGGKHLTKHVLPIPVSNQLPKPYNHERVTVKFALDDDLVLHVSGKGATQQDGASVELHDLCFGLKTVGEG